MIKSMSLQQLKAELPQAFVEAPSQRVSERYSFIPTHQILEDLGKLGWLVRDVVNPKYKGKANQAHGKHLVRLFHPDIHISNGDDKNHIEIALYNSSNGLSKFKMEIGVFRFICSNGLVIKTEDFGSIQLRHKGYSFDALKESIDEMIAKLPDVAGRINTFVGRELTAEERFKFAQDAYSLRNSGKQATEEEIAQILTPRRDGDVGNNLWVTFNVIQESIVTGGTLLVDSRGRMKTAKPIKNLDKSLKLNQDLWELAEAYAS